MEEELIEELKIEWGKAYEKNDFETMDIIEKRLDDIYWELDQKEIEKEKEYYMEY